MRTRTHPVTRAFEPVRAVNGERESSISFKSHTASTGWKARVTSKPLVTMLRLARALSTPGNTAVDYRPQPIDTSQVQLDPSLLELTEYLARNTHEVWARRRM